MSTLNFFVLAIGGLGAIAMSICFVWVAVGMTDHTARNLILLAAAVVALTGLFAIAEVLR